LDLVHRRARRPHRGRLLSDDTAEWLENALGTAPRDLALYVRALTHGSHGPDTYERLEFLGDRILGLVVAEWLYAEFPSEPEGALSRRLNTLVTGAACAEIGRDLGLAPHLRLGKQARDDGAYDSDNVLGDVVEALIGALYLDQGLDAARAFIQKRWADRITGNTAAPRHPKSALQEWAAAQNRRPPAYEVLERSGPHHAPRFTVKVSLGSAGEATAEGRSKQEAEALAAALLLDRLPE
jgi:ribonuclease III